MDVSAVGPFTNVACPSCGKPTRVKREFGPYTLVRRHAIGGMSLVFIAQDNTLGREVALKILNESYSADVKRIAAFEEEARITASFSHPHVVRVFTTGIAFDRFYIAMELVAGGHFEHQIRERGTIPERDLLPFAIQVAEGLKAAHNAGLIHRDIKPGNILLDSEGNAKIVDFGLALVTKGGRATAQELWATPYYVPPETLEGQPEDFRSDLYAFGATLYHALAGQPSCAEESMSPHILREAKQKVVPLQKLAPWISLETCAVVERAMAYDPKARFDSYDEMIALLRVALQRAQSAPSSVSGGASRRASSAAGRRKSAKRSAPGAVVAAGLLVVASIAAAVWWVSGGNPPPETNGTDSGTTFAAPDSGQAANPADASRIAARYRDARAAMEAGDYAKAGAEFAALRDDREVQEPTRTWAGIEALAAALLDGKHDLAREQATAVERHLAASNPATRNLRNHLLPVVRATNKPEPIPAPAEESVTSGAAIVLAHMLAGLKNWEQGMFARATPLFESAAAVKLPAQDAWAGIYQKLAADYLADFKLLAGPAFATLPADRPACESAVRELDRIIDSLKTRGRSRFNVRAWQLDIQRHARLLDALPTTSPPATDTPATDLETFVGFTNRCRFAEAASWIKSLEKDPPGASREALLALAESAGVFLADLESDLKAGGVTLAIALKDGTTLTRAEAAEKPGHFTGIDASAGSRMVPWGDVTADSVIEIHRLLVRNQAGEPEKLARYEGAVAFEWLAGDRARARTAAERLAAQNPGFQRRWESISAGLPE